MQARQPVVAGLFYDGEAKALRSQLDALWPKPRPQAIAARAAMVPHAGYMYSGRLAARVIAQLEPAATYILLGPNHTGHGHDLAIAPEDAWVTPLGQVPVNKELARRLLEACDQAQWDARAHSQEHSLEVQLPFLQKLQNSFSIVAIAVSIWEPGRLAALGMALAQVIRMETQRVCILASSDMNHFENLSRTQELDRMALDAVLALDPEGLLRVVRAQRITMCGAAPTAAMLTAAKALGARQAQLVGYATSAEASGDEDRVVGYAGVIIP